VDLTLVPYMDSMSLGVIIGHYVRCQGKGFRMIVKGASPRVLELFKIANVEMVLRITA
jgi:anti-anti-sigma factor